MKYISKFSDNGQGLVCLVIYTEGDPQRTISTEVITSIFGNYFEVTKITPSKEGDAPPDYFIGKRG